MSNAPKVTILSAVTTRTITTSKGLQKPIHSQDASLETEQMRIKIDIEVDGPNAGYRIGEVFDWDIAADLVPGRFGVELARRKTLRPVEAPKAIKAA